MVRDLRGESEFGLPSPMAVFAPDGDVVDGVDIEAAIAAGGLPVASNDKEAFETGGDLSPADELRRIYATDQDSYGPREPKAGTQ